VNWKRDHRKPSTNVVGEKWAVGNVNQGVSTLQLCGGFRIPFFTSVLRCKLNNDRNEACHVYIHHADTHTQRRYLKILESYCALPLMLPQEHQ
jgi:hypothetical protein